MSANVILTEMSNNIKGQVVWLINAMTMMSGKLKERNVGPLNVTVMMVFKNTTFLHIWHKHVTLTEYPLTYKRSKHMAK